MRARPAPVAVRRARGRAAAAHRGDAQSRATARSPRITIRPRPRSTRFSKRCCRADTVELLAGIYGVAYPALAERVSRSHRAHQSARRSSHAPAAAHRAGSTSTRRVAWGAARRRVPPRTRRNDGREWTEHLRALSRRLRAASPATSRCVASRRPPRASPSRRHERFPSAARRAISGQYNFEFPPHVVYNMPDVPRGRAQPRAPLQANARDGRPGDDGVVHDRATRPAVGVLSRLLTPAVGRGATRNDGHVSRSRRAASTGSMRFLST